MTDAHPDQAIDTDRTTVVLDQGFFDDPDALYRALRARRPVAHAVAPDGRTMWLVTRYDDARAALTDRRLAKDSRGARAMIERRGSAPVFTQDALLENMLNSDPPTHTRLRKLVGRAFTVRAIERLRPRVEELATELADAMTSSAAGTTGTADGHPTVDLLDAFAFPLPMTVISEILGVPPDRRDEFRAWSNTILSSADPASHQAAGAAMSAFLTDLVAHKAAHPADDVLTEIVRASADGDSLSAGETTAMAFLLLVAGHETTVNLIGNGMLALLRHPDQAARLRAEPGLVPNAVEEFLRYDGPVNLATLRYTTEPVTIAGTTIPADEQVLVSLIGANRDPQRFADPDRLDVTRDPSGHVAFGHGIHHCLGAPLARLEGDVAFRTLLDRFPAMSLAAEPGAFRVSTLIHGLTSLPVRLM